MKSPRFDIRAAPLRIIFSAQNLEAVWRKKVRVSMREQILRDGIEHFDFHVSCKLECQKLSRIILEGNYVPSRAQRILVEKSKGLCRQIVIPSPTTPWSYSVFLTPSIKMCAIELQQIVPFSNRESTAFRLSLTVMALSLLGSTFSEKYSIFPEQENMLLLLISPIITIQFRMNILET